MKNFSKVLMAGVLSAATLFSFNACNQNTIYVDTNAFFAPFEYYQGTEIKGVDVDIMNMVGEKLGKKVKFENTDFDVIIDNVESGKKYDCGAAGITITEERAAKVDFSNPYYTSVQYVIYKADDTSFEVKTANDGTSCVYWSDLMGKKIGVQKGTTGWKMIADAIESGVLKDSGAEVIQYDNGPVAYTALKAGKCDVVVIDELPAKKLVK